MQLRAHGQHQSLQFVCTKLSALKYPSPFLHTDRSMCPASKAAWDESPRSAAKTNLGWSSRNLYCRSFTIRFALRVAFHIGKCGRLTVCHERRPSSVRQANWVRETMSSIFCVHFEQRFESLHSNLCTIEVVRPCTAPCSLINDTLHDILKQSSMWTWIVVRNVPTIRVRVDVATGELLVRGTRGDSLVQLCTKLCTIALVFDFIHHDEDRSSPGHTRASHHPYVLQQLLVLSWRYSFTFFDEGTSTSEPLSLPDMTAVLKMIPVDPGVYNEPIHHAVMSVSPLVLKTENLVHTSL